METNQDSAPFPPVALGTAFCPLPENPALSPLLTWVGRGPRHGAGCIEWWPEPPQTGEKRASGTVSPPGHLHTGLGVLSHSPEAEGEEAQGVHTCTSDIGPTTHLPGYHSDSLCPSVQLLSKSCSEHGKSCMCSACAFAELQPYNPLLFYLSPPLPHAKWPSISTQHLENCSLSIISGQASTLPLPPATTLPYTCSIHVLLNGEDASSICFCTCYSHIPTHCQMPPGTDCWVT